MITLNGERGFETVETWEEILAIPGFMLELDPKEHKLKEIIGRYLFRDYISCGLSNCRQPHGRGYLVTTKSGHVTNIGNGCGKTHFGVEFQEQSRIFDRAITEHNNRETLATFLFQVDENIEHLKTLRTKPNGADWVYKTTRPLLEKGRGCPEEVVSKVNEIVRSRNGSIATIRQATEDEAKEQEAIQNKRLERPYYIEEKAGTLRGIEALYPENNIRSILIKDLEVNLSVISDVDIDAATYKELGFWVKWVSDYDSKVKTIDKAIEHGKTLLSKDNLLQLISVISDRVESQDYKRWVTKNT